MLGLRGRGARKEERRITHNLGAEAFLAVAREKSRVHVVASGHREGPVVLHLPAEVEVDLGDEDSVPKAGEARCAGSVGSSNVGRPEEPSKVLVGRLAVARRELVGVDLAADPVAGHREVTVSDGGIASLDAPQRLGEASNGGAGIANNLGTVEGKAHPVQGVMPAVADVDADAPKDGLEDRMPISSLDIIVGLVEIADAGDVIFGMLSDDGPIVADDNGSILDLIHVILVAFDDGRNDYHVVGPGKFLHEASSWTRLNRFGQFAPREFLPSAHEEGNIPSLLEAEYVHTHLSRSIDKDSHALMDGTDLFLKRAVRGGDNLVLNCADPHKARAAELLFPSSVHLEGLDLKVFCRGKLLGALRNGKRIAWSTIKNAVHKRVLLRRKTLAEDRLDTFELFHSIGDKKTG